MEEVTKDFSDYLDALRRRRLQILTITGIIFAIGCLFAFLWPPTYHSAATILIEEQEIPAELVQSTVTSYAVQRIEEIKQRVMTRNKMTEIIEKYNLYEDERKRQTSEEIINSMREDIFVTPIGAEVVDPRSGRPSYATIAFTLGFNGENPTKTQKVASELTTMFLQENLENRASKASETYKFLTDEANRLSDQISQLDARLAQFKMENKERLPELQTLNTALLQRVERDLEETRDEIRELQNRKMFIEGQLGLTDPHGDEDDSLASPYVRLKALRTELLALQSRYSETHPDVIRIKRQVESLEVETGQVDGSAATREELKRLRNELSVAKERYSDSHPDVVQLNQSIAALEKELAEAPKNKPLYSDLAPDNPVYVTLKSQLRATETGITAAKKKENDLIAKLAEIEKRLMETPEAEREFKSLSREHANAIAKFQEIRAKQLQAKVAQQLEQQSKGERFTLIDPAALPEEPISPNRPAILFLSLVFALGGGVGFAALREGLDSSIRGTKGLINAVQMAPLAVIPYLQNEKEVSKGRRKTALVLLTGVAIVAGVVTLIHLFWLPLDVIWFKALRRASILTGMDL